MEVACVVGHFFGTHNVRKGKATGEIGHKYSCISLVMSMGRIKKTTQN